MAKRLPTDLSGLRKLLRSLKDREIRLEADLAIKDHPEMEDAVISVMVRVADAQKAKTQLDAVRPTDVEECSRIIALQRQATYFRERLKTLEEAMKEAAGEKFTGFQAKYDQAQTLLSAEYLKRQRVFDEHGISLRELLPCLDEYLPFKEED